MFTRTVSRYKFSTLSTVNLNNTINGHLHNGNLNAARQVFDENPHTRNVVSWNSIINGYMRQSHWKYAEELFDKMPQKDVVSWNTMLSGFRQANHPEKSFKYFLEMTRAHEKPNELTFAVLISAFLNTGYSLLIPQLHGRVVSLGLNLNDSLGSALMRGYLELRDCKGLCRVFDEISVKDVAPWNVLILGFMEFGLTGEAKRAFTLMPVKNAFSWSSLINGYIKNKMLREARSVLDMMTENDVVCWTAMIKGYVQWESFVEALELFVVMLNSGPRPNHFTFSSVLDACAGCSSLLMGNQVHSCILKFGIVLDVILSTSLLDMYAKCGDIEVAYHIFQSMPDKNLVSWNSMIGGYARHGLARTALEEFERMVKVCVRPDEITFINVLSACGHGGMVEEGERIFNSMNLKYSIQPEMEHYACIVDLYGKAGQLDKAEKFIRGMPFEPDVIVWGALLGACGLHSCLETGESAASRIYKLQQDHPAVYTMLSKIHGENEVWNSVAQMKKMIRSKHARKQKAGSWIESHTRIV
ncbi:hypothetical protein ACH5RR_015050 [Cinchona calisaya]|uniref:Pentatricopeptide repeat-containing protein n=1 Tax=Cinchona calisaya TaxID=153742 RepID=A0ABD2ZS31_9GENT